MNRSNIDPLERLADLSTDMRKILKCVGGDLGIKLKLVKSKIGAMRKAIVLLPSANGSAILKWSSILEDYEAQFFNLVDTGAGGTSGGGSTFYSRRNRKKKEPTVVPTSLTVPANTGVDNTRMDV